MNLQRTVFTFVSYVCTWWVKAWVFMCVLSKTGCYGNVPVCGGYNDNSVLSLIACREILTLQSHSFPLITSYDEGDGPCGYL